MTVSMRPQGSSGVFYNPQRDLAYCYAPALEEAFHSFSVLNWDDRIKSLGPIEGVTEEAIMEGAKRLANAHLLFIGDDRVTEAYDALNLTGFTLLHPVIRMILFARLGETLMGGAFMGVRDVTRRGELPPQIVDIAAMVAAGRSGVTALVPSCWRNAMICTACR